MTDRWVVYDRRARKYVGPNRRMVDRLLAAGHWSRPRAVAVAGVDPKHRVVISISDAAKGCPDFAVGSVAEMLVAATSRPIVSTERPDGYVFTPDIADAVIVSLEDGARIGEVGTLGCDASLLEHSAALAFARSLVGMDPHGEV